MNSSNIQSLIPSKCLELLYPSSSETNQPHNKNKQKQKIKTNEPTNFPIKTKQSKKKIIWMMGDPPEPIIFNKSK